MPYRQAEDQNAASECAIESPDDVQVEFSRDGNYLYTGARRDTDIFCWDVRYTSDVVYRLQRDAADTNQRIQFDIEPLGRHLASGEHTALLLLS